MISLSLIRMVGNNDLQYSAMCLWYPLTIVTCNCIKIIDHPCEEFWSTDTQVRVWLGVYQIEYH